MSRTAVEFDFFNMEKQISPKKPTAPKLFDRRRSFRDIQSVISKINPEVLKTVIATGSVNQNSMAKSPAKRMEDSPLPVYSPILRPSLPGEGTTPMTIFYNGTVAVFNVPMHKAESILKLAEEGGVSSNNQQQKDSKLAISSRDQRQMLEKLDGDLPITRRKSLQRFLEKRKERITLVSPYGYLADHA